MADKPNYNISKPIIGAFNNIKNSIIPKSRESLELDSKINSVLNRLTGTMISKDTYNYAEIIKSSLTKNISSEKFEDANVLNTVLQSPDLKLRQNRYTNADELLRSLPHFNKALNVLKSGILSPDNVSKETIQFIYEGHSSDEIDQILSNCKSVNNKLEIESNMEEVVKTTLKYGDYFVEICDYTLEDVPITQSLYLTESGDFNRDVFEKKEYTIKYLKESVDRDDDDDIYIKDDTITKKIKLEIVMNGLDDNALLTEDAKSKATQLDNVRLIYHNPKKVIKLQSERYKMPLGYLVLPIDMDESNPFFPQNPGSKGMSGTALSTYGTTLGYNQMIDGVDLIYKDLIKLVKKYVNNSDLKTNKKEIKDLLTRAVKDLEDSEDNVLKVRYIPPDRMEHFSINVGDNFPYGEGLFEKVMLQAKFLILQQISQTIRRVTDASDKRAYVVDVTMNSQAREVFEQLKELTTKKKFSMDTFSNIGSIPSMLTTNETFIIPQSKGRKYVEIETIPSAAATTNTYEDIKLLRDFTIAALDVPPAFIGIEENISNKSLMAHESSMFAVVIMDYQKQFSKSLFSLFFKLYKFIWKDVIPKSIKITFPAPRMLSLERERESLETSISVVKSLEEAFHIPLEYLKTIYLPQIDWAKVEEITAKIELEKRGTQTHAEDQMTDPSMGGFGMDPTMGMMDPSMGGMGGMGGMMPPPAAMADPAMTGMPAPGSMQMQQY